MSTETAPNSEDVSYTQDHWINLWAAGKNAWNEWVEDHPVADIDFREVSFSREARSRGMSKISFSGYCFPEGKINFDKADFGTLDVTFTLAKFSDGEVSFSSADFGSGDCDFTSAVFGKGTKDFSFTIFNSGNIDFSALRLMMAMSFSTTRSSPIVLCCLPRRNSAPVMWISVLPGLVGKISTFTAPNLEMAM